MYQHRFIKLLLLPSLSSGIICFLLAAGILISVNWSVILDNLPLYDYFFGANGAVTHLRGASGDNVPVVGEALSSRAVTILVGALAAVIVFAILARCIISIIRSITWTMKEMHAVEGPAKRAVEHELRKRITVRFLIAGIWLVYALISVKIVLPFAILASQLGFGNDRSVTEGIGYVFFALTMLIVALHLHVVMARLLLLRPRVFGEDEALLVS